MHSCEIRHGRGNRTPKLFNCKKAETTVEQWFLAMTLLTLFQSPDGALRPGLKKNFATKFWIA